MHITFIQTGGTIDKDYPQTRKGWAFEITTPAVERILEKLNPTFSYDIVPLLKKDSLEINEEDRDLILDTCKSEAYPRIVITHGTDTLLETAKRLSKLEGKVIILTGSMRPERFINSDAPVNLGLAIGAAQCLPYGVYLAMHGQVLPWDEVTRDPVDDRFIPIP